MTQYATPDADISDGNWVDEAAGQVDLYNGITPDTPGSIGVGDDTDYIESPANPTAEACGFGLSTIEDPASSSGHIINWRAKKDAVGGGQIDLTVQIRETYVSEASQGTLIGQKAVVDLTSTIANDTTTLSGAEADTITDYADLQIRFVADQST
jgi:hypothetical protein